MYGTIQAQIKEAMKNKNILKRDVLKQVQMKVQTTIKEGKCEVTDEIVLNSINKEIKQLNQTLTSLAGKEDCPLYKETSEKLAILTSYLPKQLSSNELRNKIIELLASEEISNQTNWGKKTGLIMKHLRGQANGSDIKNCLDDLQ